MATTKPTKAQAAATAAAAAKKAAAKKVPAKTAGAATAVAAAVVTAAAAVGINLQHLTHIVSQTNTAGFCYSPKEVNDPPAAAGYVEVREDTTDGNGGFATRATEAGIAYVASQSGPFGGATATASPFGVAPAATGAAAVEVTASGAAKRTITKPPEGGFVIAVNVPLPPVKRGFGPKAELYPFTALEVGGSFFVAATEARPDPSKSLASTVNSAMNRFAAEVNGVLTKTRVFALRRIEDGAPWGQPGVAGAGVFRTA